MSGSAALATGYLAKASESVCGVRYELDPAIADAAGADELHIEFRENSPEDLDGVLIKGDRPRTRENIGVGTRLAELQRVYGATLVDVGPNPSDGGGGDDLAVFDKNGALMFSIDYSAHTVSAIQALRGTSKAALERVSWEC